VRHGTRGVAALGLLAVFCCAGPAGAYCRTTTCDPLNPKQSCEKDPESLCISSGAPLFWASSCVSFTVQQDGSPKWGLDADTVSGAAAAAFSTWINADCGGAGPSISAHYLGPVVCDQSRYNKQAKNANIIMFRDDEWPYPGSLDAYALTIVRFDPSSGELYDADVEVNSADFTITADGGGYGADLQAILTHELGHFLGMSHVVGDPTAVMRQFWDGQGLELRDLTEDDAAGICDAYPPDRRAATSSCTPRHGFASECEVPLEEPDSSCGFTRPARDGGTWPLVLVGVLVGGAARLRRHRRARG
jgi:hypothetical protein